MTREEAIQILLKLLAHEQLASTRYHGRKFQERTRGKITALEMAIQLMDRASDDDFPEDK